MKQTALFWLTVALFAGAPFLMYLEVRHFGH